MKRASSCVLVLLILMATPVLHGQDKEKLKESPLFPLKVGAKWHYKVGDKQAVVEVKMLETVAGLPCARVVSTIGADSSTEHLTVKEDGAYRVANEGVEVTPVFRFLKLPAKKGDSWDVKSTLGTITYEGKFTLGEEEVKVPAGKYQAITVSSDDLKLGGTKVKMTSWFAPGVGMVKQTLQADGSTLLIELEKYEPTPK